MTDPIDLNWVVEPDVLGERLDRYLSQHAPAVSRTTLQRWIKQGRVLVNGNVLRAKDSVWPGDSIVVSPAPPPPTRAEAEPSVAVNVVFEDDYLIVVDKPPGLVVHPARGHQSGTLVNGLLARPGFARAPSDQRDPDGPMRPGIVHRIDKDTSGLLVVAKTEAAREGLKEQLARHDVTRSYLAITVGVPASGVISTLHGRHPTNRLRFTSLVQQGKQAVTHVEVVHSVSGLVALVRCRLETGRTHQIRVHLAERAHTPLLADALYGRTSPDERLRRATAELGRQALHAAELGFEHPVTKRPCYFQSPLPKDMELTWSRLSAELSG